MNKALLYIIMCIMALAGLSCAQPEPRPALDAAGDGAQVVAMVNLMAVNDALDGAGTSLASHSGIPELGAIASLRGVDFKNALAVSYNPSMSAIVFSITNKYSLRKSLRKISDECLSDSVYRVHKVVEDTYFVADTAWNWLVDSPDGPEGARGKVVSMLAMAVDSLGRWKRERLESSASVKVLARIDNRYVYGNATFEDSGVDMHALCLDSAGGFALWLPADVWQPLSGNIARINHHNEFSLACGPLRLEDALQTLPPRFRFSLADAGLADFSVLGSFNVAVNGLDSFRATIDAGSTTEAERLADASELQWGAVPGVNVSVVDSTEVVISSRENVPEISGTSFEGCNLAVSLQLPGSRLGAFTGDGSVGLSAIMIMHGSTMDGRIDFIDSPQPFLATLIRFLKIDGKN